MTLGKFEGIGLCPRLRSFKDRRLHIPRGGRIEVPESLRDVCIADVSLDTITKGWSELSNIADVWRRAVFLPYSPGNAMAPPLRS